LYPKSGDHLPRFSVIADIRGDRGTEESIDSGWTPLEQPVIPAQLAIAAS
jgi:hypothetical protein